MSNFENEFFCQIHNERLAWEEGGVDKPTMFGRLVCVECDKALARVLDEISREDPKTINWDLS